MTANRQPLEGPPPAPAANQLSKPTTGLRTRPYITINLCFALSVGGWIPVATLLAVFMRDYIQAGVIGAMVAVIITNSLATGMSLYAGTIAARWGSRRTYLLGVVGMTIYAALLASATEGWHVIGLAPFAGLIVPFHWTGANLYVLQAVEARRRGTATGITSFVMVLGPGIGGPLMTTLGGQFGIWAAILGGSGLVFLALLGAWILLPEIDDTSTSPRTGPRPSFADYPRFLADRVNLIIASARWISGLSFGVFQLLSALVILDLTAQLSTVGFYLSAGAIGGGASQVIVGAASDRFGRRNLLIVSMLIGAGSAILFWQSNSLALLLVGAAMQWFGQAAFQTLISAICGDIAPPRDLPTLSGLHVGLFSLGMVCGGLLGGLLWATDPRLPFLLTALCFIPITVGLFFLPQRTLAT